MLAEKKKDYAVALEEYTACLGECREDGENAGSTPPPASSDKTITFMKDLKGEIMLRIAVLRKEMGLVDLSMQMCNSITAEPYNDAIRANALCLKVILATGGYTLSRLLLICLTYLCCGYRVCCMRSEQNSQPQRWCTDPPSTY